MTDTEKNIAVAEFCGWAKPDDCILIPPHRWKNPLDGCCYDNVPNYGKDLNAMHEAVLKLTDKQMECFCSNLMMLATGEPYGPTDELYVDSCAMWKYTRASAEQRRDALLMTIGKLSHEL